MYRNFSQLMQASQTYGSLAQAVLENEMELTEKSSQQVYDLLEKHWQVMQKAALKALDTPLEMEGMLISGQAQKQQAYQDGLCGTLINSAMAMALSCSEVNASMGRICAAPTAGACGVLPAVLTAVSQKVQPSRQQLLDALLVASGVGAIITRNASVSGAEGGCQAECGTAAAMAAAAAVTLCGGTDEMVGNAVSIVIMNCLGLVCDPVAGLVQLPCSYRNASQAVNALLSADLALAGQLSVIPPDECIEAMSQVGRSLSPGLRETSDGGIASSPTAKKIQEQLHMGALT